MRARARLIQGFLEIAIDSDADDLSMHTMGKERGVKLSPEEMKGLLQVIRPEDDDGWTKLSLPRAIHV